MKFKNGRSHVVFLAIAVLLYGVSIGRCQEPPQPLELIIKSDKEVFEVGDEVQFTATLVNNSSKEFVVFWNNESPVLRSYGIAGGVVMPYWDVLIPSQPVKNIETLYIKPNNSVTKNVSINKEDGVFGGSFIKLRLRYDPPEIPLNFKTAPNQEVWTKLLISNTIPINVKDWHSYPSREQLQKSKEDSEHLFRAMQLDKIKISPKTTKPDQQAAEQKVGSPKGLEFLADVKEFQEFNLGLRIPEVMDIVKRNHLILSSENYQSVNGVDIKTLIIVSNDGETLAISFTEGKCTGIQRLQKPQGVNRHHTDLNILNMNKR